jgi:hypothetical protein
MRYGIFALLGDTGGILEVYLIICGFILFPISEHSFILTAAKKLYMARTTSDQIFDKIENRETIMFLNSDILTNTEKTEIRKHKTISIDFKRSLKLYFIRLG